ncbi:MAG: CvpA family protein [Clostridia bacterium]|nr:CvpA family protein [Clostridia bacterium]
MGISQIVNISSIGLLCLIALIGFFRGRKRGFLRSLIDVVFFLINVVISVPLARWITDIVIAPNVLYKVLDAINGGSTEGFLAQLLTHFEEGEFLASADLNLVFALFEVILTPIIYILTLFLAGILLWIIKLIVIKCFIPKLEEVKLGSRFVGGLLRAAKAVLVFIVYLVPIIGFATYGVNTIHSASDSLEIEEIKDIEAQIAEYEPIVTEGTIGAISKFGGQWLFEMLSTKNVGDVQVSLVDETENVLAIYNSIVPLTEIESSELTSKEADLIDQAINEIDKSEYLTATVASVLSQFSKELYNKKQVIGYDIPDLGTSFNPVLDELLVVWSETDRAGLVNDLRTYSAVFRSTVEQGLFKEINSEDGDIFVVLEKSEFYSGIFQSLNKNSRTKRVVPVLANALQSYLYAVYEEINGYPYGSGEAKPVDESKIDENSLNLESIRVAAAIKELRKFSKTTEDIEYVEDIVKKGDFVALGTGLNNLRDSIFFGNSYEFLLNSILHSEACSKLGIFDENFVKNAIGDPDDPTDDADMVQLLLSRQKLATLTMAMWDGDKKAQEESLKVLISNLSYDPNDPSSKENAENEMEALKELAALENLDKYGVRGDKGNTVSNITTDLVDTIHDHKYTDKNGDGIVDQADIDMEAEATAHIITVLSGVHNNVEGTDNVFGAGEGASKTGESADKFVADVMSSSIAKEMMDGALEGDNKDPYGIHGTLTENDKANVESALTNYSNNPDADQDALEDLAAILGVNFSK